MEHPIRKQRKAQGMTLVEVSSNTGLAASSLSKMENRKITPLVGSLKKLADCFGVDWRDLVED